MTRITGGATTSFDSRRVMEAVGCTLLAGIAGDNAVRIARAILLIIRPEWLDHQRRVMEVSLIVILVATALSVVIAAHAIRRRWVHVETFVVAAFVGVFTAFFVVIDYSVLIGPGQPLYFFGWVLGLWFFPALFLPNPDGTLGGQMGRAFGLFAVAAPMTVIGLATGVIVEQGVSALGQWTFPTHELYWSRIERFWIAKPVGVNAIGCTLAVVACANRWWPGLQWSKKRARTWTGAVTVAAAVYAGLWGPYLYGTSGFWAIVGFGALPVMGVTAVCLAYAATRERTRAAPVGWGVSKHFWWLLPTALLVAFALSAAFGLVRVEDDKGPRAAVLVLAHGLNGVVMGASLAATGSVFRLMPESVSGAATWNGK